MKQIYFSLIALACVCVPLKSDAQHRSLHSSTYATGSTKLQTGEGTRAQNFFVELLGQGIWVTANYDTRFGNRRDGLGARIGIGAGPSFDFDIWEDQDEDETPIIFPVGLNYLLGNGTRNFFEIGLGATFITGEGNGAAGTMSFSYRLQPLDRGFSFRGGLTPLFDDEGFYPLFGGLSLGYTF